MRRPISYRPSSHRVEPRQVTNSATNRWVVDSGSSAAVAISVRVRRGWDESNVPSTDSAREVTLGRVAVLAHRTSPTIPVCLPSDGSQSLTAPS